ncbi:hypothetical protein [Granulicella paludicola]|uniref:hypothetical protein n=1 Tax=Granulicella paludicola TaxID=474951 RepID=UPI0021DFC2F6|nr:hypothetical protein [Granulicella paludicola]
MNRIALLATALFSFPAFAQTNATSDHFIQARQAEVEKIAESLYSTHLDSRWTLHTVGSCGSFTHHAFASFVTSTPKGARFVAIYDLDHAAARSADRPWEGGVRLLRVSELPGNQDEADLVQNALLGAFNHAVLEEKTTRGREMDPADEAVCLLLLAGESLQTTDAARDPDALRSTKPVKVSSILIPLAASAGTSRTASVLFNPDGTIAAASLLVRRKPSEVAPQ